MGFSSYNCLGCGYSIRSEHACRSPESLWMVYATMVLPSGLPLSGYYDGYGRIVTDAEREEEVEVPRDKRGRMRAGLYHTACWELLKRPSYTKASPRAEDQGFFCGSSPSEPKTRAALANMRRTAAAERGK